LERNAKSKRTITMYSIIISIYLNHLTKHVRSRHNRHTLKYTALWVFNNDIYIFIFYNNNNSNSLLLLLLLFHTTAYDDDDTVLRSDHSLNVVTGRRAHTRRMFPMNGTRV